jgi:pyruvate/2-oxoglutarate/acetoin dehydrogenase E1 component
MRELTYVKALNEALWQLLETDERVLLIGQGVNSPWYVGTSTIGLLDQFGPERVIDTPICEDSTTGIAVGAAIAGMRPIVAHPRVDFALLAMEQLVGQTANWHYMSGGKVRVPMVTWLMVNRGGEQAAQHSQSLQAYFAHHPGLEAIMPSTPHDVKGLLIASVQNDNPVIFLDDRWLYKNAGPVPEEMYTIPIGKAAVRRKGRDMTIVATSYLAAEAVRAITPLEQTGIDAEIIDLRTIRPIDTQTVIESVKKTGRLIVADGGWAACGVSAEVAAIVAESDAVSYLKAPVQRLALPPAPAPATSTLEQVYFHGADDIVAAAHNLVNN